MSKHSGNNMTFLKLYRGSDIVGIITNPIQEGPETIAGLKFTEAASKWKELFLYMINDIDTTQDPPPELNVFEDWYIEDENGNKKPIFMPGIFEGGTYMSWRWKRDTV